MLIGYVRVSTNDQNTALQRDALERSGCELIFEDKMSGRTAERPGLKKITKAPFSRRYACCLEAGSSWAEYAELGHSGGGTKATFRELPQPD